MASFKYLAALLILLWGARGAEAEPSDEALATVVIYNAATPGSEALAKYYAKQREIPSDHLLGLKCSANEEISRTEYDQTIAAPVRSQFIKRGWWEIENDQVTQTKIRFVALMRGMPMKIAPMPLPEGAPPVAPANHDEASVDSELSCLGFVPRSPSGIVNNPYFDRLTPILESQVEPGMLLVCRLDAMSDATVRRMIDDSIAAEKKGLWGWAYIDTRGLKDGPFLEGDQWMSQIATNLRHVGVPVFWDKSPTTIPLGYPVTDAALYYGWYAFHICGAMADPEMRFRPGAVAVHLYSFSANTLRPPNNNRWCAQLLEHGAAATLGNVYEPYLELTAHLDIFQGRLMNGYTFAESAYMSLRALSWMNVSIGDPLYRPYATWKDPSSDPGNPWMQYRQIVVDANGDIASAAPQLLAAAKQTGNSMFLESLAAVQADGGEMGAAVQTLTTALALHNSPLVAFRLGLEKMGLLGALRQTDGAQAQFERLASEPPSDAQTALLVQLRPQIFPASPTKTP